MSGISRPIIVALAVAVFGFAIANARDAAKVDLGIDPPPLADLLARRPTLVEQ